MSQKCTILTEEDVERITDELFDLRTQLLKIIPQEKQDGSGVFEMLNLVEELLGV